MSRTLLLSGMVLFTMTNLTHAADDVVSNVVLGIHGGIGVDKKDMTPEHDKEVRAGLTAALQAGQAKLKSGGSSLDAVEAAIRVMEDLPVFNAGKGAVFTHAGTNELDASIMDGKTKKAGSVAGVMTIKNPITGARAVMEKSKHVMLIGPGADAFAKQQGLDIVDPKYFETPHRRKAIEKIWRQEEEAKKKRSDRTNGADDLQLPLAPKKKSEYGTVGAVALDAAGNLAAGTSTGGMTNKMAGRVGDSPIIGAGTYADNEAGAISCTGYGEFFIRYAVSHEIVAQMKYKGSSARDASHDVINRQLTDAGGEGAAIVLDKAGRFATAYNSEGLYRACITKDGTIRVRLYEE
ncbi:MAG: isoaspartyl peptidase/L-asparaginase [Planctomycetota bacterium]